ncbi:ParB/RepB/Spo0J family partition protein [Clostridium intestinale]|uniref:ParB/RepB/Spo0J family partition protein n=1 Tax=Clostridium intestinale TaxID=36845 RepID=UPI002DD66C78|nr:DUF3850 domain-containing protein [Clostridium intestinale]WRY49493.1 DUF3850 domain-containing protein [Clostridium intestinale]
MVKFNMMDLLNDNSKNTVDKEEDINKFKIVQVDINDLKPSKDNFYSIEQESIKDLKDTIELVGLQQNLVVKKESNGKYEIIAGHRRYRAIKKLYEEGNQNFKYVPCKVEEDDNIKNKLRLIITNSTTRELSDWEKITQVKELRELLTEYKKREKIIGRTRDIIANILNVSSTQIARMESVDKKLIHEYKEELKGDKIKISAAYELSKLPVEKQKEIYKENKEEESLTIRRVKDAAIENKDIEIIEGQVSVEEVLNIDKEDLQVGKKEECESINGCEKNSETIVVDPSTGEIINEHNLKVLPKYFKAIEKGIKLFEVRKDDRDYQVGDTLVLSKWDKGRYLVDQIKAEITYILGRNEDEKIYVPEGYVILGIKINQYHYEA